MSTDMLVHDSHLPTQSTKKSLSDEDIQTYITERDKISADTSIKRPCHLPTQTTKESLSDDAFQRYIAERDKTIRPFLYDTDDYIPILTMSQDYGRILIHDSDGKLVTNPDIYRMVDDYIYSEHDNGHQFHFTKSDVDFCSSPDNTYTRIKEFTIGGYQVNINMLPKRDSEPLPRYYKEEAMKRRVKL